MAFNYEYPYTDPNLYNSDWLIMRVKDVDERMTKIEDEFSKIKVLTKEEIQEMIDISGVEILARADSYTDLVHEIIKNEYKAYTDEQILILKSYVDVQDENIRVLCYNYTDGKFEDMKQYVDSKLIDYTFMINPLNGRYEDVRDVLNAVINRTLKENSISAGEYDAKHITAGAYDALMLTAYNYDFNAKNLLP